METGTKMIDSNTVERFCREYRIEKMSVEYLRNDLSSYGIEVSQGALCKLELPYEQLFRLIETQEESTILMLSQVKEKELRNTYESVQTAYNEYQLLLTLTQKEENEFN